jgi:hypothetical protein
VNTNAYLCDAASMSRIILDDYFQNYSADEYYAVYEIASQCLDVLTTTRDFLSRAQRSTQPIPLPGAKDACARARALWQRKYAAWGHHAIDASHRYCLMDLVWLCATQLQLCADPVSLTSVDTMNVSHIHQTLSTMQLHLRTFHLSGSTHAWSSVRGLLQLQQLCGQLLATGLSHFTIDEAFMAAPTEMTSMQSRHATDEVQISLENRTKEMENGASNADADDAKQQAVVQRVEPSRFLATCSRLFAASSEHVNVFIEHQLCKPWHIDDMESKHLDTLTSRLTRYIITNETEKRLQQLHLGRSMPLGAIDEALRFVYGRWDTVHLENLMRAELGTDATDALLRAIHTPCQQVFNDNEAVALQQSWLLVLLDRSLRTEIGESLLDAFVVASHELTRKRMMWRPEDAIQWSSPRRPVLIEAMSSWAVSVARISHTSEVELFLIPCADLRVALHCWACYMQQEPFHGRLANRKTAHAFLQNIAAQTQLSDHVYFECTTDDNNS